MKNIYLILLFIFLGNVIIFGQKAEVVCGSPYPKLDYGYVNYNDNDLGRILKITYKTNFLGNRAKITNIDIVGKVRVDSLNISISNIADSIISIIGSSSAVNVNISAIPPSVPSSVSASILSEITKNLSILMVGKIERSIDNISRLRVAIESLNLPNLDTDKKVVYAICNQVQLANKLVVGLKKGNNFTIDLSVDVPSIVSASGKISIDLACSSLAAFKGNKKLAFYNFTPIDNHGKILSGFTNKIMPVITRDNGNNPEFIMDGEGNIYRRDRLVTDTQDIVFVDNLPTE